MNERFTLPILISSLILTACASDRIDTLTSAASATTNGMGNTSTAVSGNNLPVFTFEIPKFSDTSDDEVHTLIKKASQNVQSSPRQARKNYVKALSLVKTGKAINEYDYLWTRYGLIKSSHESGTGYFGPGARSDYLKMTAQTLDYLNQSTSAGIAEFTEFGAFQKENYRVAGNGLAWSQMEDAKTKQALETALDSVEQAVNYIDNPEHYYILDTKVRILLKLKREKAAFTIVKEVLDEVPNFGDFQDFAGNKAYQKWLNK